MDVEKFSFHVNLQADVVFFATSVIFLSFFPPTLTEQGIGVMMESSSLDMASLMLLNYTGGRCGWLLIIWKAVYVCVCVCVAAQPLGRRCEVTAAGCFTSVWRGTKQPGAELKMRSALSAGVGNSNPTSHTADQEFVCCNVPLWCTDLPLSLPWVIILQLMVSYISQNAFQQPLGKGHKLALFRGYTEFSSAS